MRIQFFHFFACLEKKKEMWRRIIRGKWKIFNKVYLKASDTILNTVLNILFILRCCFISFALNCICWRILLSLTVYWESKNYHRVVGSVWKLCSTEIKISRCHLYLHAKIDYCHLFNCFEERWLKRWFLVGDCTSKRMNTSRNLTKIFYADKEVPVHLTTKDLRLIMRTKIPDQRLEIGPENNLKEIFKLRGYKNYCKTVIFVNKNIHWVNIFFIPVWLPLPSLSESLQRLSRPFFFFVVFFFSHCCQGSVTLILIIRWALYERCKSWNGTYVVLGHQPAPSQHFHPNNWEGVTE